MKYRRLGRTDLRVSVVGVGTWQFGGEWGKDFEQDEVDAILKTASDLGINLIDTAECYGDHLSEEFVGRAIQGQRDQWIVATKFGHKFHRAFERDDVYGPDEVRKQLEASLKALRIDAIDLYQFHSGTDAMFDTEGLWQMLHAQQQAGKIRHLGISISKSYDGVHQIDDASAVGASAFQVVYNRLHRKHEKHTFHVAVEQDLGVLARVPLASGFLSGKFSKDTQFDKSDVRGAWMKESERLEMVEQVERIKAEEVPPDVPMAQWALAWALQHPAVTCVIPGCKNVEQARSNALAADLDMVRADHPQVVK
ncbi:MAG: aldo/keto reductase [Sedimentisphaerales bacterium]|nr:aldo/keto reductase [Sedimentisphaerales bacterium]